MNEIAAIVAITLLFAAAGQAVAQAERVPLDGERAIGGVTIACTGIGQERNDPRWNAYPVRIESSDTNRAMVADEIVSVSDRSGAVLATVQCEGPWILLRPSAPGPYTVKGWLPGAPSASAGGAFRIPAKGQTRIELRFPVTP
ncbi:MAG: hypothetical protein ACREEB_17140 [Caulobacteraceae bacterium]